MCFEIASLESHCMQRVIHFFKQASTSGARLSCCMEAHCNLKMMQFCNGTMNSSMIFMILTYEYFSFP